MPPVTELVNDTGVPRQDGEVEEKPAESGSPATTIDGVDQHFAVRDAHVGVSAQVSWPVTQETTTLRSSIDCPHVHCTLMRRLTVVPGAISSRTQALTDCLSCPPA